MANNYENRIIYGMSNIHLVTVNEDGTFGVPVKILGAKSVEATFETVSKVRYGDNGVAHSKKRTTGGSGKLSVLGLTTDEKCLISGTENQSGAFVISEDANAPSLALLFEQEKEDGGKLLNVIYNCQFDIPQINAVSTEEDVTDSTFELDFTCLPRIGGKQIAQVLDTTDVKADTTMAGAWFTAVQLPKPTVTTGAMATKVSK